MLIDGIETDKEEIREFQKVFPSHPAAVLLGKILENVMKRYMLNLKSVGSSIESMRQAQGALEAMQEFEEAAAYFIKLDLEKDVGEETEEELEDGTDIG